MKLVFVWLIGFCFVFCFVFIILERLFLIILLSSKSIHPLPSGLSQRASSLYLLQRGLLNLVRGAEGGVEVTLALDPPTRELTVTRAITALPGPPPSPPGRGRLLLHPRGTVAQRPEPGLWHSALQSRDLHGTFLALPQPLLPSWRKEGTESEPP